jgi:hypothetical protein
MYKVGEEALAMGDVLTLTQAWITEGGIRCPAIVHLPPRLHDGASMYREHRSDAL